MNYIMYATAKNKLYSIYTDIECFDIECTDILGKWYIYSE